MLPRRRRLWLYIAGLLGMTLIFSAITQVLFLHFEGRHLHFHQALLFVAETLSTTGYGELLPFRSPVTTIWSLLLMGTGFVTIFVGLAALAGAWLSDRFQTRAPRRAPRGVSGHIIICGAGPVGQFLAEECRHTDAPYLLVSAPGPGLEESLRHGLTVMEGDPRESETLQAAGIDQARALVATRNDADNASICLVARALHTELPLYATVEHAENQPFLLAAGAREVVSAKQSLGERLGWLATAPLAGQLDRLRSQVSGLAFCQVPVLPGSELVVPTLREARLRERTGATVLGLWRHGHFIPAVDADMPLRPGEVLIAAGRPEELQRLRAMSQARARGPVPQGEAVLVLGAGDVGAHAARVLRESGIPCKVMSLKPPFYGDPEWVQGDATSLEDLERAGIAQMGRCIVALDDDSRSTFATLMVRQLNPGIRIAARANAVDTVPRLYLAGADNVLAVSEVAGSQLARLLLPAGQGPPPLDALATQVVQVPLGLIGRSLADAHVSRLTGCLVLAVGQQDGSLEVNPAPRRYLERGEALVLFGTEAQFERFEQQFGRSRV